jgi:transglutaminase-like putative cysteine protease
MNGRAHVNTPSGSMRMRTYQIRTLEDRIKALRKLVEQGKRDPYVYEFSRRAVNGRCGDTWCVPEKDNAAEIKALFKAVRDNVRYTSDILGVDTYQLPAHTLRLRTADCDDYTTVSCALANALGLPCRMKVIRTKGAPEWNHIYAQIGFPRRNPTKWISFDASVDMPLGWEAPPSMVDASKVFYI